MASSSTARMDAGDAPGSGDAGAAQQQAPPEALTAERTPSSPDNLVSCSFDMLVSRAGRGGGGCWTTGGQACAQSPACLGVWASSWVFGHVFCPTDVLLGCFLSNRSLGGCSNPCRLVRTAPTAWCAASWSGATQSCRQVGFFDAI